MSAHYLLLDDEKIKEKDCVEYLGVHIDNQLCFNIQVKHVLSKMAQGIKYLYVLRNLVHSSDKILLLNAFVISPIQYSAILLTGINANLLTSLEKQLSWAVKACFNRKKLDSSKDLKIQHSIMPIKQLLEYRCSVYAKQFMAKCKPAFTSNSLKLPNSDFYRHERTGQYVCSKKNQHTRSR